MGDFYESLFGCLSHPPVCLLVGLCPVSACCVQAIAVDKATNEGKVVPILCICFLGCIGLAFNRHKIRSRYLIPGNMLKDLCVHIFCSPCAVCQEYREVNKRADHDKRLLGNK